MARIGARKHGKFKAVSTAPSFNKTPVGSSTPPLPYPVTQDLSNSLGVVSTVRLNKRPAYVLNQSTQSTCKGDAPGICKGVKSGTVSGEVKPLRGSSTVRVGKKPIIRQGDPCTMNGGNCPGVYVTSETPSVLPARMAAAVQPSAKPETPAEKSFLDNAAEALKEAGQWYKDNASEALHDFAGNAMDTGGTIAAAGGGTAAVGGVMVATGVGAAPGAVIAAGGGAVAAVGGGVAGVGGIAESAATALDAAADFATSGQLPNMTAMATAYAQRMVMSKIDKLTKLIPGKKDKQSDDKDKKPAQGGGNDGFKVVGVNEGRCTLKPYRKGCPPPQTPHHVVPDHSFKQPGKAGGYYPGTEGVKHADGLCICVGGATKSTATDGSSISRVKGKFLDFYRKLADHGKIHVFTDAGEHALGKAGTPKGTTSLGAMEKLGARVVGKVTGCDPADLEKQLREYHQSKGLGPDTKVRADPFGQVKNLEASQMGTGKGRGAETF
jgi:hypothetical protein